MDWLEAAMALRGASLFIAVGGLVALAGGLLSILGAVKNNQEQQEMILGDARSFCQLTVYVDVAGPGFYVSTYHHGTSNIYDVQVLIHEVSEDGTPLSPLRREIVGIVTRDTWPWPLMVIGLPAAVTQGGPRYFSAQVNQRNGTSLKDVVVYPRPNGRVELGFLRLTFNGSRYEPDFRLLPQGVVTGVVVPEVEIARVFGLRSRNPRAYMFGGSPS
jgi:hypothetical protein